MMETYLQRKNRQAKEWKARNPGKATALWKAAEAKRWKDAPEKRYYSELKAKAKKKSLQCLSFEEFVLLIADLKCAQSGLDLTWDRNSPWRVSIDRVDSSKGYEAENCQAVAWLYNAAKNRFSDQDVLALAEAICQQHGK